MQPKPVRTYLDPDAVGPLPRSLSADDSDELSAARTMVRLPDAPTQEISVDDVLEVIDPKARHPESLAPVGYELYPDFRPRRQLVLYVLGVVALAGVLIGVAISKTLAVSAPQPATAAPAPLPTTSAVFAPAPAPLPAAVASTTTGTLRIDDGLAAQRVYLDGVPLKASATELQCGPHDIAVGAPTRARRVDVPCGGDITVFR